MKPRAGCASGTTGQFANSASKLRLGRRGGRRPSVAVTSPARMQAAPASCSADGDSSTISAANSTEQTGCSVSRIDVTTAGSRGSDAEISSQPTTCDESASSRASPSRPGRRQVEVAMTSPIAAQPIAEESVAV